MPLLGTSHGGHLRVATSVPLDSCVRGDGIYTINVGWLGDVLRAWIEVSMALKLWSIGRQCRRLSPGVSHVLECAIGLRSMFR